MPSTINAKDIFNINNLQIIQDEFAVKTGVASLMTYPNGIPITAPSNFSRLCMNVIRNTPKGLANCIRSDAIIGRFNRSGPIIQPCLSGGLWDAGASINLGNQHIANWLIGQVLNEAQDIRKMMDYARKIEADIDEFSSALSTITVMPQEKFINIGEVLFLFALYLSKYAEFVLENKHFDVQELQERLDEIIHEEPDVNVLKPTWEKLQALFPVATR
jgi:ligand-binding sensor protein